VYVRE
jgi:hypothetical protein